MYVHMDRQKVRRVNLHVAISVEAMDRLESYARETGCSRTVAIETAIDELPIVRGLAAAKERKQRIGMDIHTSIPMESEPQARARGSATKAAETRGNVSERRSKTADADQRITDILAGQADFGIPERIMAGRSGEPPAVGEIPVCAPHGYEHCVACRFGLCEHGSIPAQCRREACKRKL